ncbi:RDD family protein [Mangrovibacterium lignilyticum]|uniref:RDD family protein n=1 Tax=Mangrovibacterium lignilyticum TaxID=2668052 RepID=UPI0013D886E8|nr:RDD family protein [Mangrovibacterium lignilyticum]
MIKTPLEIEGISDSLYAGFWRRLGALLLDFLLILPFTGIIVYVNSLGLHNYSYTVIPSFLFGLWYNIYLVQRYGATPGKLIAGIKIVTTSGEDVNWKHAILRHLVLSLITLFSIYVTLRSIGIGDAGYYDSLSWVQKTQYLAGLSPILFSVYTWSSNIWVYGELIVLLTNKRKRAVHDFMASTVIIKTKYQEPIRNNLVTID